MPMGEVLNELPNEKTDRLTNAHRHTRNVKRLESLTGHSESFLTVNGEISLKAPKLCILPLETVIEIPPAGVLGPAPSRSNRYLRLVQR